MVAGVELLQVLLPLGLGSRQRDLRDLAHLRRPATEGLDELAKRQAAGRLRSEAVLMSCMHGPVYYRPCAAFRAPRPSARSSPADPTP